MWFQVRNICLFPQCMVGKNLNHNTYITTSMWLFNSLWRHFWLVVSLTQTSFHTHFTVGKTPPWQHNDHLRWLNLKKATVNKNVAGKNLIPSLWMSLKVEAMPDQERQVHSVEWVVVSGLGPGYSWAWLNVTGFVDIHNKLKYCTNWNLDGWWRERKNQGITKVITLHPEAE